MLPRYLTTVFEGTRAPSLKRNGGSEWWGRTKPRGSLLAPFAGFLRLGFASFRVLRERLALWVLQHGHILRDLLEVAINNLLQLA